ncbi:hypothetical protein LEMLEM_LOCUS16208 [Lemmus lemmus]
MESGSSKEKTLPLAPGVETDSERNQREGGRTQSLPAQSPTSHLEIEEGDQGADKLLAHGVATEKGYENLRKPLAALASLGVSTHGSFQALINSWVTPVLQMSAPRYSTGSRVCVPQSTPAPCPPACSNLGLVGTAMLISSLFAIERGEFMKPGDVCKLVATPDAKLQLRRTLMVAALGLALQPGFGSRLTSVPEN